MIGGFICGKFVGDAGKLHSDTVSCTAFAYSYDLRK